MSMELTSISVYPLKGASGIRVQEWPVSYRGFAFDRCWMLVDQEAR